MVAAILEKEVVSSPTVGRWFPTVATGSRIRAGQQIGRIWQARQWIVVLAPKGASGVAVMTAASGDWCERGDSLIELAGDDEGLSVQSTSGSHGFEERPDGSVPITSETDGTVYLRPSPDASPYVSVGTQCANRDTLALVEVMKTFTPVRASNDCEIVGVLVEEGAAVSAGDVLFWVRPT